MNTFFVCRIIFEGSKNNSFTSSGDNMSEAAGKESQTRVINQYSAE